MQVVHNEVHYDTAEENIMRSLEYASGDYVWFLGDDDPINIASIDYMLDLLQSGQSDCFIFNSVTIWPQGAVESMRPMPMHGAIVTGRLDEVIESIGLINTFAGLSNIIQRRENLSLQNGLDWLGVSKIYSHVAWFIDSQKGRTASFVNSPLVYYRLNDYSNGHWNRVAERIGVPNLYFWSLGVVRLLTRLIGRECLTYRQAGVVFELAQGGARYRLIDDIVFKTYQQLLHCSTTPDRRQQFSTSEFGEIQEFCLASDPTLYTMFQVLSEAHQTICMTSMLDMKEFAAQKLSEKFLKLYNDRQAAGQHLGRYVGNAYGFSIFRMTWAYVGVRAERPQLTADTLRYVDPIGDGLNTVSAKTYHEVLENAAEANRQAKAMEVLMSMQPAPVAYPAPYPPQTAAPSFDFQGLVNEKTAQVNQMAETIRNLENNIRALYDSTSWRVSAPLRAVSRLLKRQG